MNPNDFTDGTTLRAAHGEVAEGTLEIALQVVAGVDEGAGCVLSSRHAGPLLVGQSATCDLRLRDRAVSRRHAAFDASSWPVRVIDLGSTNGTFVNGVSVVEARLVGGESIKIGGTTLIAERCAPGPRVRLSDRERFGRTLGASAAMRRLYPICEQLAASMTPVMIEGEAGTGKELLAESLHEIGPRAAGPFLVVDCATGGEDLVRRQRASGDAFGPLFAQAVGGTLVLDEVGELDATLQRALSRALAPGDADVRVLVATRKNLDWLVQHGRFREDLYAHIATARVELPPLRARHGDVRLLARHFWREGGGEERAFPEDVVARAESHAWPGNVRELRELVSKLLVPGAEGDDASSRLGALVEDLVSADLSYSEARRRMLVAFENRYVERMLEVHHGNVTRAAAASGLARRNFQLIRARRKD